jgi:hypothetical protein
MNDVNFEADDQVKKLPSAEAVELTVEEAQRNEAEAEVFQPEVIL